MAMTPRQPGGLQNLSVDHMSEIPGRPLSNITPGSFPHNTTGVGATGLGPATRSPGQGIAPGGMPSGGITSNKGTFPSNEIVVQPLVTKQWLRTEYHLAQRRGDILFVQRESGDHPNSSAVLNIAQLSEMLRDGYKKLMAQRSTSTDTNPKTNLVYQQQRISEKFPKIAKHLEEYMREGEVALTADDSLRKKIQSDRLLNQLMYISKEHLLETFNYAGVYMSDGGREVQKHITLNIGVKGPTLYQEVINFWGNVHQNEHLYLIWTRRKDEQRSTPTQDVYAEFYFKTWHSYDGYPPQDMLKYTDPAGIVQDAAVIHVGYVVYTPLQHNDEGLVQVLLGNSASSLEAFQKSAYAKKVEVSLGTPKHRLGIYN